MGLELLEEPLEITCLPDPKESGTRKWREAHLLQNTRVFDADTHDPRVRYRALIVVHIGHRNLQNPIVLPSNAIHRQTKR